MHSGIHIITLGDKSHGLMYLWYNYYMTWVSTKLITGLCMTTCYRWCLCFNFSVHFNCIHEINLNHLEYEWRYDHFIYLWASHISLYRQGIVMPPNQTVTSAYVFRTAHISLWIYYASITYISAKTWSSALMKAYLWSTKNGNASWIINQHQGPRQGTKPASGKITNCSYYSCKNVYSITAHSWLQILRYK